MRILRRFGYALPLSAVAAILAGCSGGTTAPPLTPFTTSLGTPMRQASQLVTHNVGLGKVVQTKNHTQIFGFDVNQNGSDGVLATAFDVETFDQTSGTITGTFPQRNPSGTSYLVDGIFAGDVALVTRYVIPKGKIFPKRSYEVMNPVGAKKFTGKWTAPLGVLVDQIGVNQTTTTSALFATEKKGQPDIVVTDVRANKLIKLLHLDPNLFVGGNIPQFAQNYKTNQAVIALSPDGGAVQGAAPVNVLIDLKTGKQTQFNGLNNGFFHAGYVNGVAVDSTTNVAATTTELNAQVEFYDLAKQTGTFAQLPCTNDVAQFNSATGLASDPVHGLFLVAEPNYACAGGGSAILVYDEKGNLVETLTGFKFSISEPAPVLNPGTRTGFAVGGSGFTQLQQFFY